MQNFGRQDLSGYFTNAIPISYQTGMNWEFITVINESPYMLAINFSGSGSIDFPAWFKDDIPVPINYSGSFFIVPTLLTTGQLGTPSTVVTVNAWIPGELKNPQPVALSRLTNVGNVINTVGGTASAVQNDTNLAGTEFIEATVQGDSASAVIVNNNGHLGLGTVNNPGSFHLVGSSGNVDIATNGQLTVDKGIVANLVTAETGNDIGFHVETVQHIVSTVNGVNIWSVGSSGPILLSGTINLLVGGLSRTQVIGLTTVATAGTSVAHSLGVIPDFVIPVNDVGGASSNLVSINFGTMTSTHFTAYAETGTQACRFLLIKL